MLAGFLGCQPVEGNIQYFSHVATHGLLTPAHTEHFDDPMVWYDPTPRSTKNASTMANLDKACSSEVFCSA